MVACAGGYYGKMFQGFRGGDAGGTSVPHHIQCGGGCSSMSLGSGGGRERGREGRARTGGTTPKHPLIRR